ncbi:deoxycytidylate deaminase-like isoform X2 [Cheilinus undulatus]|nr:deoxycytidylate deaminase-like isoform X2 [Cheilinus undulatus]
MAVAFLSAQRSKDPNSKVGACIVNEEGKIVGIGCNGMPNGCEGSLPWARNAENKLDNKHLYVCHAELNAIMNSNSSNLKGCTVYVSLFPCNECAKLIIQAGLKKVVYYSDKHKDKKETIASKRMLEKAGISSEQFTTKETKLAIDFASINQDEDSRAQQAQQREGGRKRKTTD